MTTQQVANRLVELCRTGNFEGAVNELYHNDIESDEPAGAGPGPQHVKGLEAERAKQRRFPENPQRGWRSGRKSDLPFTPT